MKQPDKQSRESDLREKLRKLNFDPIAIIVETNQRIQKFAELDDPEVALPAAAAIQKGAKIILDEIKETRKLEADKKGNTYLMIPSGFDADGNAIFENRLISG